jgi:hypothetical protein
MKSRRRLIDIALVTFTLDFLSTAVAPAWQVLIQRIPNGPRAPRLTDYHPGERLPRAELAEVAGSVLLLVLC